MITSSGSSQYYRYAFCRFRESREKIPMNSITNKQTNISLKWDRGVCNHCSVNSSNNVSDVQVYKTNTWKKPLLYFIAGT